MLGREEIDTIAPAVEQLRAEGSTRAGPLPADTLFVAARRGDFDSVVTMYHDQGQIAMKLMGFEHGVTGGGQSAGHRHDSGPRHGFRYRGQGLSADAGAMLQGLPHRLESPPPAERSANFR